MDKPLSVANLSIFSETEDQLIGFGVAVVEGAAVGAGVEVGAGVDVSLCPPAQPLDPKQYANMRIVAKIHVNFFMVRYRNATTFYTTKSNWATIIHIQVHSFLKPG